MMLMKREVHLTFIVDVNKQQTRPEHGVNELLKYILMSLLNVDASISKQGLNMMLMKR